MLGLAVLLRDAGPAPFLGAVQIIVYTGAIMMLFLFVLMLVGVDASDSLIETLRGQRIAAIVLGVGFAVLVGTGLAGSLADAAPVGLDRRQRATATCHGWPRCSSPGTSSPSRSPRALLITAALGAMVLAHVERRQGGTSSTRSPG